MRKIIGAIIVALIALFGLFGVKLNLVSQIDPANIIGAMLILSVWIFTEFKKDKEEFINNLKQWDKWNDPVFWAALITSVVLPLLNIFNITLSQDLVAVISSVLAIIVPFISKLTRKTERKYIWEE